MLFMHMGDNRSGKTALNAFFAWLAYLQGKIVYCNCPEYIDKPGIYNHILNFPHKHINADDLFYERDLMDCYIMTDQGETAGLDSMHITKDVKEAGYFGTQATKMGVDWHFDTTRHKNILNRLRTLIHFRIITIRYPFDPRLPLRAVHVKIQNRYSSVSRSKTFWIMKPWSLFPLFNSNVLIRPSYKDQLDYASLNSIHKQLIGG